MILAVIKRLSRANAELHYHKTGALINAFHYYLASVSVDTWVHACQRGAIKAGGTDGDTVRRISTSTGSSSRGPDERGMRRLKPSEGAGLGALHAAAADGAVRLTTRYEIRGLGLGGGIA